LLSRFLKRTQLHIIKVRNEALLVKLLSPIDFFLFYFSGMRTIAGKVLTTIMGMILVYK